MGDRPVADVASPRPRGTFDESGGRYVHVIARAAMKPSQRATIAKLR